MKKESENQPKDKKLGPSHVAIVRPKPETFPQPEMSALAEVDPDGVLAFRCLYHVNQSRQMTRVQLHKNGGAPFCPVCAPSVRMAEDWRNKKDLGR